jgi:hypothetical protein
MAFRSSSWIMTAALSIGLAAVQSGRAAGAEGRFELVSRETLPELPELTVYTIRDRRAAACYTLFVSSGASPFDVRHEAWPARQPPVEDLPRPPSERAPEPRDWATLPWTSPVPGMMTGGWEYLAESMRLALTDPGTARALSAPLDDKLYSLDERLSQLTSLLQRALLARNFAVWPVSCDGAGKK